MIVRRRSSIRVGEFGQSSVLRQQPEEVEHPAQFVPLLADLLLLRNTDDFRNISVEVGNRPPKFIGATRYLFPLIALALTRAKPNNTSHD